MLINSPLWWQQFLISLISFYELFAWHMLSCESKPELETWKVLWSLHSRVSFCPWWGSGQGQFGQSSHVLHFTCFHQRPVLCVPQKLVWQRLKEITQHGFLARLTLKIRLKKKIIWNTHIMGYYNRFKHRLKPETHLYPAFVVYVYPLLHSL